MRLANCFTSILLTSSLSLVACGGGDDGGDDDGGTVDPTGTHYTFVADSLLVPATPQESSDYALDLNGDGRKDNALGGLLAALASTAGLDVKGTVTENVQNGTVIVLADLQATDLSTASGVGMTVFLGDDPTPTPCTDAADPSTCGKHLDGNGSFTIAASSPTNATLVGQIVGGRFVGGPGTVGLELPLAADQPPVAISLIGARMETGVSATGLTGGKLGGAISSSDIETKVLPAVHTIVADLIAADCTGTYDSAGNGQADCCADSASTGAKVLQFLNPASSEDCQVTLEEMKANSLIASTLLNPDLDLLDADGNFNPNADGVKDSLSLGVGFSGVKGEFTLP
jgi:hypothetical protein